MQISFYHLTCVNLEKFLPKFLEKVLQQQERGVVVLPDAGTVEALNTLLWTYHPESFLPHGTQKEGHATEQPIWLTTVQENPNNATALILTSASAIADFTLFQKAIYIFDGTQPTEQQAATTLCHRYKAEHSLTYWQQDLKGKWVQQETPSL